MRHVRHALSNNSVPSSAKQQRQITTILGFDDNLSIHSSIFLILCVYFSGAHMGSVVAEFANIIAREYWITG